MKKNGQLSLFETAGELEIKKDLPLFLYVDGASRGNPGPAGAGVCIMQEAEVLMVTNGFLGIKTNNQAEYLALALGLFHLRTFIHAHKKQKIIIRSDSQLLIRQMRGEYAIKNPFIKAIVPLIKQLSLGIACSFEHVPREENSIADEQANKGVDFKTPLPSTFKKVITTHE
jgi:ribonuclease HI